MLRTSCDVFSALSMDEPDQDGVKHGLGGGVSFSGALSDAALSAEVGRSVVAFRLNHVFHLDGDEPFSSALFFFLGASDPSRNDSTEGDEGAYEESED